MASLSTFPRPLLLGPAPVVRSLAPRDWGILLDTRSPSWVVSACKGDFWEQRGHKHPWSRLASPGEVYLWTLDMTDSTAAADLGVLSGER